MEEIKNKIRQIFGRVRKWWAALNLWQKRRFIGWAGLGAFIILLMVKVTAVLVEAALVGVGGFVAFWIIWSFLSERFKFLERFRMKHPVVMELIAFVGVPLVMGGTVASLIGGFLLGEMISNWNLLSQFSSPTEGKVVVVDAEFEHV